MNGLQDNGLLKNESIQLPNQLNNAGFVSLNNVNPFSLFISNKSQVIIEAAPRKRKMINKKYSASERPFKLIDKADRCGKKRSIQQAERHSQHKTHLHSLISFITAITIRHRSVVTVG